jgi:hypothetical protein
MIHSRILFSITFLVFAFILLMISALRVSQPGIFTDSLARPVFSILNHSSQEMIEASTAARLNSRKSLVDYQLPYPGILPDHPLYWLKMGRDRVQLWFLNNPKIESETLLLYADKRLGAGEALILGNQNQLGISTITKAEKYLGQAQGALEKAVGNKLAGQPELMTMAKAFIKHQEIIKSLELKLSNQDKENLQNICNYNNLLLQGMIAKYQLDLPLTAQASSSAIQ